MNALTMTLGNVNAAPVNFRALFLENVRLSIPSLQERVQLHYQEQFMAQIYRVLGSADFLGNPVGLFNNISSGFSDIFYEPYQGIVMHGNKDIGLGIARVSSRYPDVWYADCRSGRNKLREEDRFRDHRQYDQVHKQYRKGSIRGDS
jgi:vacuolar protein sorting-associated protein 13A/C